MTRPEHEWLALTRETALEPELEICDPHIHLWERSDDRYTPAELQADAEGHAVRETVFVECGAWLRDDGPPEWSTLGETGAVHAHAEAHTGSTVIAGISSSCRFVPGCHIASSAHFGSYFSGWK